MWAAVASGKMRDNPPSNPPSNPSSYNILTGSASFLKENPEYNRPSDEIYKEYQSSLKTPTLASTLSKAFPFGVIFSSDKRMKTEVLDYVFFKDECDSFFKRILGLCASFVGVTKEGTEEKKLCCILMSMCTEFTKCYRMNIQVMYYINVLKSVTSTYRKYAGNHHGLPNIVFLDVSPPGNPIRNVEAYLTNKVIPNVRDLLLLLPGTEQLGMKPSTVLEKLERLPLSIKLGLVKNPQQCVADNPYTFLSMFGIKSPSGMPQHPSFLVCSCCSTTVSDTYLRSFLEALETGKWQLQLRTPLSKEEKLIMRQKGATDFTPPIAKDKQPFCNVSLQKDIMRIVRENLFVVCAGCKKPISMETLITKFYQVFVDKKFIDTLCDKLVKRAIETQFPDIECNICLEVIPYEKTHYNQVCSHLPCICIECQKIKLLNSIPEKGKIFINSDYRCLVCQKPDLAFGSIIDYVIFQSQSQSQSMIQSVIPNFWSNFWSKCIQQGFPHPNVMNGIIEFMKNGGIKDKHNGRFCNRCCIPFQEPTSCDAEESRASLFCPKCTIWLAERNHRIRLFIQCPNSECGIMFHREDGCDVIKCTGCNTQFCFGCSVIFPKPPSYEWGWTCSCLIKNTKPKEYSDNPSRCLEYYYKLYPNTVPQQPEQESVASVASVTPVAPAQLPVQPPPMPEHHIQDLVFNQADIDEQIRLAESFENDDALFSSLR